MTRGDSHHMVCDDPWFHLTRDAVGEAVGAWLAIPKKDIGVDVYAGKDVHRDHIVSANAGLTVA
jgi:hypothetical protein